MESLESSISFTLSKGGPEEEMSMSLASMEDALEREADRTGKDVISNERIQKGDVILETYTVTSDAISGGMGSVWRTHHENWNVELAMKRPQPRFFAEGGQARKAEFIKECENWIDLGLHPNIVSCYYVREIGGVPTIFSEWMEGGSLRDRIRDGSLYSGTEADIQERILDIAIQAAGGLEYSHVKGLIHQDIKPGNLLLSKDWKAKVADFGLAKARSQAAASLMPLSTGFTPEYCPAEQAQGAPAEQWMDVYAWALVVLEMFAGERRWKTGAEVKDKIKSLTAGCRIPVTDEMGDLLKECVESKEVSFGKIRKSLLKIYQTMTGVKYPRPSFKAAEDTADSLNNRALSFLDLGMQEEAERLWEKALAVNPNHLNSFYNRNLFEWRNGRSSGEIMKQRMLGIRDQSAVQPRFGELMEQIDIERNDAAMQSEKEKILEYPIDYNTCVAEYGTAPGEMYLHYEMPGAGFSGWKSGNRSFYYVGKGDQYISAISVSADGSRFAIADRVGIVEVYETIGNDHRKMKLLQRFTQAEDVSEVELQQAAVLFFPHEVSALAFSPDGSYLFSASMECGSTLFEIETGKRVLKGSPGYAVCFDPDGYYVAFGPKDRAALEIWDIRSAKCAAVHGGLPGDILALHYTEEKELLVSCIGGAVLRISDPLSPGEAKFSSPVICGPLGTSVPGNYLRGGYNLTPMGVKAYPGISGNTVIAFTPDGKLGVTIGSNLCDLQTGKCLYTYNDEVKTANKPVLSRDGSRVFVTDPKNNGWEWPVLRQWEARAYWMLSVITSYEQTVVRKNKTEELLEQGTPAVEKGNKETVLSVLTQLREIPGIEEDNRYTDFFRNAAHILQITGVRNIRKDDPDQDELEELTRMLCPWYMRPVQRTSGWFKKKEYTTVSFEPLDGHADVFVPESRDKRFYVSMSRDHRLAAAEDEPEKGRLVAWDLEKRTQIGIFKGSKGTMTGICFSPDNRFVAAASGNRIMIRELQTGADLGRIGFDGAYVYDMAFDESGKRLAYAVKDKIFAVNIADQKIMNTIDVGITGKDYLHESVIALSFSLDGKRLWSLDEGVRNSLKLWDLDEDKEPVLTATVETRGLRVCMRPDEDDTKLYLYTDYAEEDTFDAEIESFTVDYDFS